MSGSKEVVAVVGMGAAGLRAAMLLHEAGYQVELFEGRHRLGGRLHTVDEGEGCLFEAGGEWIDGDHHRVLNLLASMGLEPLPAPVWPKTVIYQGKATNEAELWTDAFEDDLRIESMAKEMTSELATPGWKSKTCLEWDNTPLDRFLAENTRSMRGNWWLTAKNRSDEGDDLEKIGLLGWLCGFRMYLDRDGDVMSAYRFPQGASAFCEMMLNSTGKEVQFGWCLERVNQAGSQIELVFDKGLVKVDRLVLAIPPRAVERVIFEPPLPPSNRCSLEACEMSPAIKIAWHFEESWWLEKNWGGSMLCDLPFQQTWSSGLKEGSSQASGVNPAPLLTTYICGQAARDYAALGDPVRAALYDLAKVHPEASQTFKRGWCFDWVKDSFAGGAFSHLAPGYVLQHQEHISSQFGRVHFAGEHTSEWVGFIEGALESAERVFSEVQQSELN